MPKLNPQLLALAAALLCAPAHAEVQKTEQHNTAISRPDHSKLIYYFSPPAQKPFPLLLYLDGSSCRSVTDMLPYFKPFVDIGLGVMTMEKRGVRPDADGNPCSKEFLSTNDRMQRISDAKLLITKLHVLLPDWNGKLVVVGASEGGAIAPEVAMSYDRTVAVASLAGGGWSQSGELKKLKEKELAGRPPEEIREALAELDKQFDEIEKSSTSLTTWNGDDNTYKRWASYLWYSPLDYFYKLNAPIYIAQGTKDQSSPVESADAIQERFSSREADLTYRRYEGLDHDWTDAKGQDQTDKVIGDLLDWLKPLIRQP
jgi:dienelactone hydrolase